MKLSRSILIVLVVFVAVSVVAFGVGWGTRAATNPVAAAAPVEAATPVAVAALKTFPQSVTEALAQVPAISPAQASAAMKANPDTLVIDVRDATDVDSTGIIPGAVNISLGTLSFKADNQVPPEWRDANLANRARPIITTCYSGEMGALAAKLLTDMGFTNVRSLNGGTVAWKDAGYPTK
jgi:rhodanese-related sulfurtransferase